MAEKEEKKINQIRNQLKDSPLKKEAVLEKPARAKKKVVEEVEEEEDFEPVLKTNKPRNTPSAEKEPKKEPKKKKEKFFDRLRNDEKLHKITGTFLVFIVTPY